MKPNRIIFLLSVLILFSGCKDYNEKSLENGINAKFIDLNSIGRFSTSDIYKSIMIIPLETTDSSIINKVTKIVFHEGRYYILDEPQKTVFIFDDKGKYISKIDWIGDGPGEYGLLYDFEINRFTNNLELLDARGKLITSTLDGGFLGSTDLPASIRAVHKFCNLTDDIILFFARYEKNKLIYYSRSQDKIIRDQYEIPDFILHKTTMITQKSSPFNFYNDTISFFEPFSNNIFKIINNDLVLAYSWDFGEYNFSINDLEKDRQMRYYVNYLEKMKSAGSFRYNIENERFIYTSFLFHKYFTTLIFEKKDQSYKVIKRFKEDVFHPAFPVFFSDGIFTTVGPLQIQLLVTPELLNDEGKMIFNNLKPDDNPVIVKYYFK